MTRVVAGVVGIVVTVAAWAGQAAADELVIRRADTRALPTVAVTVRVDGAGVGDPAAHFQLREDGEIVRSLRVARITDTETDVGVALVIDSSASMAAGGRLEQAKAAAREFVAQSPPRQRIAIVSSGNQPRLVADFTVDRTGLGTAIDALTAQGDAVLWDAARSAVDALGRRPDLQANVLLLAGGPDRASRATADEVQAAAVASSTAVFAVAMGQDAATAPLAGLARATGGTLQTTADPASLRELFSAVREVLSRQYLLTYLSSKQQPVVLEVSAGALRASVAVTPDAVVSAVRAPSVVPARRLPGWLEGDGGRLAAAGLALLAVALGSYVVMRNVAERRSPVMDMLAPYSWDPESAELRPEQRRLAETTVMRRVVELAAGVASRAKLLPRVAAHLEEAAVPLRPSEALFFALAGAGFLFVFTAFITGSGAAAFFMFAIAAMFPPAALNVRISRRRRAFQKQLPDVLRMMAGALRSGFSLPQAMQSVADEVDEPIRSEIGRAVAQIRLGQSIEAALTDAGSRMKNPDWDIAVNAMRIQREVGGNLAELLTRVAETMVSRERLRQEVKALTAEGRISAIVLGLLPVGIGGFMYLINPPYITVLFTDPLGRSLLAGSTLLGLAGFFWIKKTVTIEL